MRYAFSDCLLDTDSLTLTRAGQDVRLEPQVFDLIRLLAENPDRVVTRDEIVAVVWKGRIVSESAISARIAAARKAVGDDGKRQAVIRTVARRGLQISTPVTAPTHDGAGPESPKPMAAPRVRYTHDAQGRMIAYTVTGDGPPVLNCSFIARSVELEWSVPSRRLMLEGLAARHRLACYDEIGVGLSERNMTGVTVETRAEEIRAVADAAGFDRFALFAESNGAQNAITFAAAYPDRVSRMVLSGGFADGRLRRGPRSDGDFVRALISEGWGGLHTAYGRSYLSAYCPDGPYEAANAVAEMMQASISRENMLIQRDLNNHASVVPLLSGIRCPVLVIHARHDSVHPLSEAQKLASGIPRAELFVLESGNHLSLAGSPVADLYVDTVLTFLAGDKPLSP